MTHLIGDKWIEGSGQPLVSRNPANNEVIWQGRSAAESEVDQAFDAARGAFADWFETPLEQRMAIARKFAEVVKQNADRFARCISQEMGKPLWESKTEVAAVVGKVELAIDALLKRRWTSETESGGTRAVTRYKPFGVIGVLGPFNLPAHLPNGHIVPAILAGNTVVFKPSEQTPLVGKTMLEFWQQAGLPAGVINLVQGKRETGTALVHHPELDGLFFTGSSAGGLAINRALSGNPAKIVALEMGGNNPLVVHQCSDLRAAAYLTVLSAYITSGQRCTCARRLIVIDGAEANRFVDLLAEMIGKVRVDFPDTDPEPFIGTVISKETGKRLLDEQTKLIKHGAKPIVAMQAQQNCSALLSPGLLDATQAANVSDEELFGPILQVYRVKDFDAAIREANNTRYGLSAGLLSDDETLYRTFFHRIRAGIVNWNRQTTGASGQLPFGGCGLSGNNRPAGYFSADYCSWPVASLEAGALKLPETIMTGIDL